MKSGFFSWPKNQFKCIHVINKETGEKCGAIIETSSGRVHRCEKHRKEHRKEYHKQYDKTHK